MTQISQSSSNRDGRDQAEPLIQQVLKKDDQTEKEDLEAGESPQKNISRT